MIWEIFHNHMMSYTEEGESVFDLYAAELKEKRPEKYEKLKDSADTN